MSRDWADEYSELASRKAEQIANLEEIQRKALAAAEAETIEHYQARKKAEAERDAALAREDRHAREIENLRDSFELKLAERDDARDCARRFRRVYLLHAGDENAATGLDTGRPWLEGDTL